MKEHLNIFDFLGAVFLGLLMAICIFLGEAFMGIAGIFLKILKYLNRLMPKEL